MPSIFLTLLLLLATCSRVLDNQGSVDLQLNEQMKDDLILLEDQREDFHLQQREMLNRLREIERRVVNGK